MQRLIYKGEQERERTIVNVYKCNNCGNIIQEYSTSTYNEPACSVCGYFVRTFLRRFEI